MIKISTPFLQIKHDWFKLMQKYNLNICDINLLALIGSLENSTYGCIASNDYFENVLSTPDVSCNVKRLSDAGLIKISQAKVRKITTNKDLLKL